MNQKIKFFLQPFYHFLVNVCISPRRFYSLRHYPKYQAQHAEFQKLGGVITHKFAILTDYDDQAGTASGSYFHQDLLIAQFIHKNNPSRHIDIGSRIDGFVAHVASFRKIEVMDVRDLPNIDNCNISFIQADLMNEVSASNNITDSISCLHAIEHFGLGRYGDPVDPKGHIKGFNNIIRMLEKSGTLYISFPIGNESEIHFNAHRIFHPKDILLWPENNKTLKLERFDYVDDGGKLHQNVDIEDTKLNFKNSCGIYTFKKIT